MVNMIRETLPERHLVLGMIGREGFLISMPRSCWSAEYKPVYTVTISK
jgi:hypothetical protein